MIYLSGAIRREFGGIKGLGFMRTPNMGNRPLAGPWGADTGCYSQKGVRDFSEEKYLAWLAKQDAASCLFATAPDRVGDAATTLVLSAPVLPKIRALGYRAALVAQDGLEHLVVPWESFDVLFIGGSTEWKLSLAASRLVSAAKAHGKQVHMGRVNGRTRFEYALRIGCDSVDGTYLAFAPSQNLPNVLDWIRSAGQQMQLLPA